MPLLFFQSMMIGFSGAVMPGSLLTYTINNSIRSGLKAGWRIVCGHALVEALLVALLLGGVGRFLNTFYANLIIGLGGGLFLLYLGGSMLRAAKKNLLTVDSDLNGHPAKGNLVFTAALISVANPYFIAWWAVIGLGLILSAHLLFGLVGVVVFYLGHIAADAIWYLSVSWLVGKTSSFINDRIYKIVVQILGASLIIFGLVFLYQTLTTLI